ncbi:hypothetical protein ACI2KR_09110 [Pseudomonas luteola]
MSKVAEIKQRLKDLIEHAMIFNGDREAKTEPAIQVNAVLNLASPIVLIAGKNASGKSFIVRHLASIAANKDISVRGVSMKNRTAEHGIARLSVFGSETDSSTGVNSVKAVMKGMVATVDEEDDESLLILDEPDIGLAEEYASALGDYIGSMATQFNAESKLLVIVSHSRALYRTLLDHLEVAPSRLNFGDQSFSFDKWLNEPPEQLDRNALEELLVRDKAVRRAISKYTK